jgi:hypothetical protein
MARSVLLAGMIVWLIAGMVGLGIGLMGAARLQQLLPELTIDLAALGGAVIALACGLIVVGLLHGLVVAGMRAGVASARSAALLLASTLALGLIALAAASATSAVTVPDRAPSFLVASAAALVAAAAYALVTALLVAEVRAGRGP